ncbi:MAG TPA: 2OG-Fe(II) oxygenase family protein [Ramlibacter sp.]|jgi:isopenicillin N synthase-like dioxygenase|nr:2OG-Fe(II) oxygenase family protein [Ramlibacter sp.]
MSAVLEPTSASDTAMPNLDVGPYLRGEPGALEKLARELRVVCEEVGFFSIENHGVPEEVIQRGFAASKRFHSLPIERKMEIPLNSDNVGYMPVNASMQRHSQVEKARKPNYNASFFCKIDRGPDDPHVRAKVPFMGMNQWPRDLPGFREDVIAYQNAVRSLGQRMLPVVARSLDLPADFFAPYFDPPQLSLRMLHYPVRDDAEPDQYGTGAHTDAGFLTFLMQNGVGGLQVRRTDGTWFDAPVLPGKFVVNTGDMLRRWTNERFLSTPHKVLNASGTDRYSIALFFDTNLDQVMECLPTCQDAAHPPKHAPITYRSYLTEFLNANYFNRQKAS